MGQRIFEARNNVGYSQDALARHGIGHHIVSRWENGNYPQGLTWLAIMAREYGVSADWLLGLTDDPARGKGRRPAACYA